MQFNAVHVTCHMLHVTHVTCHKSQVTNNFTNDPVCHIFLESLYKIQFNGHDKNVACHMCYMSHVTHVTCHKISSYKQFYQIPRVSYILGKLMQNTVQW